MSHPVGRLEENEEDRNTDGDGDEDERGYYDRTLIVDASTESSPQDDNIYYTQYIYNLFDSVLLFALLPSRWLLLLTTRK